VRTDIPLADQVVQVGHACLEAGALFGLAHPPARPCYLVLLGVSSEKHLRWALAGLEELGVRYTVFFEPDDDMGYTVACAEPVETTGRRYFRRFELWQPPQPAATAEVAPGIRGPPANRFSCLLTACRYTSMMGR